MTSVPEEVRAPREIPPPGSRAGFNQPELEQLTIPGGKRAELRAPPLNQYGPTRPAEGPSPWRSAKVNIVYIDRIVFFRFSTFAAGRLSATSGPPARFDRL